MSTLKFKTNINCSGCINAVTPHLNKAAEIEKWAVDTDNPDKILTIETKSDSALQAEGIVAIVEKAGFVISTVQEQ